MTVSAIMTVNDVKPRLGIDLTDTTRDAELVQFIAEISDVVEYIVGPVRAQTFTEWHKAGGDQILLMRRPVVAITSVVEYVGTVSYVLSQQTPGVDGLNAFGYFVYPDEGIIERTAYGMPCWFGALPWLNAKSPAWMVATQTRAGMGRVQVTYQAGRTVVPAHVLGGALELCRINYQQTQQSGRNPSRSSEVYDEPGQVIMGFFVPNRVRELLLPSTQTGGIR